MTVVTFKEYFDAIKKGKLIGLKCKECGAYTCPPKATCDECGSRELEKTDLSGRGGIKSFATCYVPPKGYEDEVPYVTALVELEEGPWIVGRLDIEGEKADELGQDLIGREITVYGKVFPSEDFYPDKDRRVVPMFKLAR